MNWRANPYLHLVSLAWRYAEGRRKAFIGFYALSALGQSTLLTLPFILGKIFDTIQRNPPELIRELGIWMVAYAVLNFVFWGIHGPARVIERSLAFRLKQKFIDEHYRMVKDLPMHWHQDHHSGDTINRINKAAQSLYEFGQSQFLYIGFFINFLGPLTVLAFVSPNVAALAFASGVATMLLIRRYDKVIVPLLMEENEREHRFSSAFFDYVSNITTIISLRIGERTRAELNRRMETIYPVLRKYVVVNEWKWFSLTFCRIAIEVAILLFYLWWETNNGRTLMVGTAVMVYQYLRMLSDTAVRFAMSYELIIRWRTNYLSNHFIEQAYKTTPLRQTTTDITDWQHIRVEKVRFSYQDADHHRHSLKGVNIDIQKGKRIALVGRSGSGKSTLLALLRGMYEPKAATVYVDGGEGQELRSISPLVTLIPQDPEIFENTVRYNITTGIEHSEEELKSAMDIACFTDVAKKLPEGIETDIREKGVNLSGGQKQRLALARGVFAAKASSILLLDEPTSSVDSATERRIYKHFFHAFKDKAIISSIHRLHLLEQFDYIYVLDNGEVVEQGALDDLLAVQEHFTEMWNQYHKQQEE